MPITELSCFVCGATIEQSGFRPGWMGQFRALYTVLENWNAARVSGVGERHQSEDVIPLDQSVDVDVSQSTMENGLVQIDLMRSKFGEKYPPDPPLIPRPLWGFPVHDPCWDLLCSTDARFQEPRTVQALFDLCMSHPTQNGVLNWGHNYGGLVGYDVDVEKLLPGEEVRLRGPDRVERSHQYNPMDLPMCITGSCDWLYIQAKGDSFRRYNADKDPKFRNPIKGDPFGRLAPELLLDILFRLDSRSVANIRLASRVMVNLGLPEMFWFSRFWPGRECEHIFAKPAFGDAGPLWINIYDRVQLLWNYPSVKNRRRIWNLACQLRDWVILRLESPVCHGSLCKSFFHPDGANDDKEWHMAESRVSPGTSIFSVGCRSLNYATATISGQISEVWASLITLNGKRYVSGLRISQPDAKSVQLGYRHPKHEVAFTWDSPLEPSDPFVGFHVAMDNQGIRGLRMISAQGVSSRWNGDHEGVPKKSITCNGQVQAVKGGFDALKMVLIAVNSLQKGMEQGKAVSGESALWYPELPDPTLQLMPVQSQRLPRLMGHMPYSMCLFGGDDGKLLPYLTEISVWVVDRSDLGIHADNFHIWALEFHYSSQEEDLKSLIVGQVPEADPVTGTYKRHRYQVFIDSPNGERINGVDTLFQDPFFPFGLTFHTNYGRSMQIPPNFGSVISEDDISTNRLRPTQGTIVGLFGVLKHGVVFQHLGVVCIPS
ncbi:F-box domain-containing protein [Fusarium falciforme]|uniref:F-box domain-containing protein n=1 Tax=Fusarium falciforme TaxID=195108 RepID=UPI00230171A8|nr:F-box domain-containing protein [Fusarium falciforme]WAO87550.1 F-box domain-containing protein [Fusarium falciforme]